MLRFVAEGLSNAEIAAKLFVGPETVKTHVGSMLARDRTHAVIFACQSGFVA